MTELLMAGNIESALSHMALAGLAAIVEDRTGVRPRFWWTEDWPSRPVLTCDVTRDAIAGAVQAHAQAHSEPDSWMTQRVAGGPRDGAGLFAPRATALTQPGQWREYTAQRRAALVRQFRVRPELPRAGQFTDQTPSGREGFGYLDAAMLVALGESAWWLIGVKERKQDDGASRWEMADRGSGRDFVRNRLSPLAAAVAARSIAVVWAGLSGATVIDEVGQGVANPRSSSGLATPGPTDNALAWCALWGLACAPTLAHRAGDPGSRGMSSTPGTWPRNREHPTHYALPVFTEPTTVGRWSSVLISRHFDIALRALASGIADSQAQPWLREQGVRAVAIFPSRVIRSGPSARPERQLLTGWVHPL